MIKEEKKTSQSRTGSSNKKNMHWTHYVMEHLFQKLSFNEKLHDYILKMSEVQPPLRRCFFEYIQQNHSILEHNWNGTSGKKSDKIFGCAEVWWWKYDVESLNAERCSAACGPFQKWQYVSSATHSESARNGPFFFFGVHLCIQCNHV